MVGPCECRLAGDAPKETLPRFKASWPRVSDGVSSTTTRSAPAYESYAKDPVNIKSTTIRVPLAWPELLQTILGIFARNDHP